MIAALIARLSPAYVHTAGAALLIASIGAFTYFQARPIVHARAEARALQAELADRRAALQQAQASSRTIAASITSARSALAERLMQLVPRSHLNERLEALSGLVEAAGMQVDRLAPGDVVVTGPFPAVPLQLAGHGPYQACQKLVESLHTAFADTAITGLRVKATPENPDAPATLEVELLWYTAADDTASRGSP